MNSIWGLQPDGTPEVDPDLNWAADLLNGAIGYDMLFDFLANDEISRFQAKIADGATRLASYANRPGFWTHDLVQNHNWVNYAAIGVAGQALRNEHASAPQWRSMAEANFKRVKAVQDLIPDGSWHEGIGYMSFGLARALVYLIGAGGENDKTRMLAGVGKYILYSQLPNHPRIHLMTHGDANWVRPEIIAILRWAARRFQDQFAEEAAKRWSLEPRVLREEYGLSYITEYVAYDPNVVSAGTSTVALDLYNSDQQSVIMRSSWDYGPTADGIVVGFKAGVLGGRGNFERIKSDQANPHPEPGGILNIAHDHMDDLGLWIYGRGGWQLPEQVDYNCCIVNDLTGYWTKAHNTLLINGEGQLGDDRNKGSRHDNALSNPWFFQREASLTLAASTEHYAFARGDGTRLYPSTTNARRLVRTVSLSRDGRFIALHDLVELSVPHRIAQLFPSLNPNGTGAQDAPWLRVDNNIPKSNETPSGDTVLGVRVLAPTQFATMVETGVSGVHYAGRQQDPNAQDAGRPPNRGAFESIDDDGFFGRLTVATQAQQSAAVFLEVLWPAKVAEWSTRPDVQPLDPRMPELGFVIPIASGSERWIYNTTTASHAGNLRLDGAQIGVVRVDTAGFVQRAAVLGQGTLTEEGPPARTLVSNPEPDKAVEVAFSSAGAVAHVSGEGRLAGLQFHGPHVKTVVTNGIEGKFTRAGETVIIENLS